MPSLDPTVELPSPPWKMTREGVLMAPSPGNPDEVEGVLNPASAVSADGTTYLFPRAVARDNYSRIGVCRVERNSGGRPVAVERLGWALEPTEGFERNAVTAGVEDPRITYMADLNCFLMTYTAFGPAGPRIALAQSRDLVTWERLGMLTFSAESDVDLNVVDNKDAVIFPTPVQGPSGKPAYALLHRPALTATPGIWISYFEATPAAASFARCFGHRPIAWPQAGWEALKIGAGPPPLRVAEGWLLLYHGVRGELVPGVSQQQRVEYSAGAMVLDPSDPSRVLARSQRALLRPTTPEECQGTVPRVVFPTAITPRDAASFDVFYGAADTTIAVARLSRTQPAR